MRAKAREGARRREMAREGDVIARPRGRTGRFTARASGIARASVATMTPEPENLPEAAASLAPFVEMMLGAISREYPYHATLMLARDQDLILPRLATPAFASCFDWHSSVHSHWGLARALRFAPAAPWAARARAALATSLSPQRLEAEAAYLTAPGHEGFERPYGLAWLLQLGGELRGWDDAGARHWAGLLLPLERLAASRLMGWIERLQWPVRSGEHSQSAFATGLFMDFARDANHPELIPRIAERAVRLYGADREAPVRWEPSGQDFLSPLLGEADLMRRAMPPSSFAPWLAGFLPPAEAPELARWLTPVVSPDQADGKFAHLDGLNLTRAWMLEGIVSALPAAHGHGPVLAAAGERHRDAGLAGAVSAQHWAGTHWLGSFATYLLTRRGIA
jgi:hypothetical protein